MPVSAVDLSAQGSLIILAECPAGGTAPGYGELKGSNTKVATELFAKWTSVDVQQFKCNVTQTGGASLSVDSINAIITNLDWGEHAVLRHVPPLYPTASWIRISPDSGCGQNAGTERTVWRHGTIAHIDGNVITPSFAPAAELCSKSCRVQVKYANGLYKDVDAEVVVGANLYVAYMSELTGATCQKGDTTPVDQKFPAVDFEDAYIPGGAACVDEDGDFLDDVTGTV
ncbi:MAG: hypothetical protein ING56_08635, partial [Rhodocyclaceae bacterium]|nr:hypothetical protein [Rhodocyclaceae bacterium]